MDIRYWLNHRIWHWRYYQQLKQQWDLKLIQQIYLIANKCCLIV